MNIDWLELINTVAVVIVGIILYGQRSLIEKMKSFIEIFDIEKVKKTTDYILDGEKTKFESTLSKEKERYEKQLLEKETEIKELQKNGSISDEKTDSEKKDLIQTYARLIGHSISQSLALTALSQRTLAILSGTNTGLNGKPLDVDIISSLSKRTSSLTDVFLDLSTQLANAFEGSDSNWEETLDKIKTALKEADGELAKNRKEITLFFTTCGFPSVKK